MTLERHGLGYIGSLSATDIMMTAASIFFSEVEPETANGTGDKSYGLAASCDTADEADQRLSGFSDHTRCRIAWQSRPPPGWDPSKCGHSRRGSCWVPGWWLGMG